MLLLLAADTTEPLPVPRLRPCLCSLSRAPRGLTPGVLGRRRLRACGANPCSSTRPPTPCIATLRTGSERGCRDSVPCVAGRGRGAGAPPAPGMRARALASTSLLPVSRLEPPLADSGERKCAGQPPCRAPGLGASGNVSRATCPLLRVSLALERRVAPRRDSRATSSWLLRLSEPCYKVGAVNLSFPYSVPLGHLRSTEGKELAQNQTVAHR